MSRFPFRAPEKLSLEGLQSEFSGLIERWWHRGFSTGPLDGQDWAPPMELRDEPDFYRVTVELPGIDRSAIELAAQATSLTISGERHQSPTPSEDDEGHAGRVVQTERCYGSFKRVIALPGPVRVDAISAALTDGVLEVTLPKAAGPAPSDVRIEIQTPQG